MKLNGHGKSTIISDGDYIKIRKALKAKKSKLLLDLARYTGERWGALIQLRIEDVFDGENPRAHITFRASTRKAGPDGKRQTRQVPVHPQLNELLEGFQLTALSGYLFESPIKPGQPISLRAADLMFRSAVGLAGLEHKGYSTHSTRRTFITRLYERGVDIHSIQRLTGHSDLKSLIGYIEHDPERDRRAIATL